MNISLVYFAIANPLLYSCMNNNNEARSAVALIRSRKENTYLILQRAFNDKDPWSGQLALPGGRRDPQDENLLQTAIRECYEEAGLILQEDDLIKQLPIEHAGVKRGVTTCVQPFLFEIENQVDLVLQESEICRAFWIAESYLKNDSLHKEGYLSENYPEYLFRYITIGGVPLWGFTYKVIGHYLGFYW